MGTMGIVSYVHRKRRYNYYHGCDGYPAGLGVQTLEEIPKTAKKFKTWLTKKRKALDKEYNEAEDKKRFERYPDSSEHLYEIDLDNMSFNYRFMPLYRLDHMPPRDIFLRGIGIYDHYGVHSFSHDTPEEYCWPPPAPTPAISEDLQKVYSANDEAQNKLGKVSEVSVDQLLGRPTRLSIREQVRVRFLELTIGTILAQPEGGSHIARSIVGLADRMQNNRLQYDYFELIMQLTFDPSNHLRSCDGPYRNDIPRKTITEDFGMWNRKHVYTQFFTHLHDPAKLRDQVAHLVNTILRDEDNNGRPRVVFGVAFDFLHVVLVRVDRSTKTFTHTPALQFFPSRFATSASTPGIEALARLADLPAEDDLHFYLSHWYSIYHPKRNTPSPPQSTNNVSKGKAKGKRSSKLKNPASKKSTSKVPISRPPLATKRRGCLTTGLPAELWMHVANFVDNGLDLVHLALTSRTIAYATLPYLKYPQIGIYGLGKGQKASTFIDPIHYLITRSTSSHVLLPPPSLEFDPKEEYAEEDYEDDYHEMYRFPNYPRRKWEFLTTAGFNVAWNPSYADGQEETVTVCLRALRGSASVYINQEQYELLDASEQFKKAEMGYRGEVKCGYASITLEPFVSFKKASDEDTSGEDVVWALSWRQIRRREQLAMLEAINRRSRYKKSRP
ncbi:hypothetical protein K474DRAFT_1770925 [Panus rudis PR-1116 ss-1]|nr:hypothetical protein K474DRAFT_1770925 [Panus rudis PR-1116 ss-1]